MIWRRPSLAPAPPSSAPHASLCFCPLQIANHMRLRHPHIIALHEVRRRRRQQLRGMAPSAHNRRSSAHRYTSKPCSWLRPQVFLTKSHLVLAMEYAAGGDLFRYVSARRGLPEDEARWFFQQLIVAVDYCHRMVRWGRSSGRSWSCRQGRMAGPAACRAHPPAAAAAAPQGVTSRDIKLENTLLDGGQWPLIKVRGRGNLRGLPGPTNAAGVRQAARCGGVCRQDRSRSRCVPACPPRSWRTLGSPRTPSSRARQRHGWARPRTWRPRS